MNRSTLYITDKVVNYHPHVNADLYYYCVYVEWPDGEVRPALFTAEAVRTAVDRAQNQLEDIPMRAPQTWFGKLMHWAFGSEQEDYTK